MRAMDKTERDIVAALLKTVYTSGLIPEAAYRAALDKLFSSYEAEEGKGP